MTIQTGNPATSEEISDRLAIEDVLHCHSRGLDRLEEPPLKACYWPDAEVDYGAYKGPAQAFVELVMPALRAEYELTRHCVSNILVEFRGSLALCESYVSAAHLLQGAQEEMLFSGRYLDTLEKRGGSWKLLHRQVVMDWSRRYLVSEERQGQDFAGLAKGGHGKADPLNAFLGQTITRR